MEGTIIKDEGSFQYSEGINGMNGRDEYFYIYLCKYLVMYVTIDDKSTP